MFKINNEGTRTASILLPMKLSGNHRFSDDFRDNRSDVVLAFYC